MDDTQEAMALEKSSSRMYVNNRAKNQIDVIDRNMHQLVASWPVTMSKTNVAMALDEPNHRLFVGCRGGHIVVFDTLSGKELSALPITKGVDDVVYDAGGKCVYASADGNADIYEQTNPDNYRLLAKVPTGPLGRNPVSSAALRMKQKELHVASWTSSLA